METTLGAAVVNMARPAVQGVWLGPARDEAVSAFKRAREAGMSIVRSWVVGTIGSFRDCWMFRAKIAEKLGCSVRTVQRAITQAKDLGLVRTGRAKLGEKPPGVATEIPCGWSHRFIVGRGLVGAAIKQAVELARGLRLVRQAAAAAAVPSPPKPAEAPVARVHARTPYQRRNWTAQELDAELARLERLQAPPD